MKSVGEVMAIGRSFQESFQKALRGLETGLSGLDEVVIPGLGEGDDMAAIRATLGQPTPDRLLKIAQAMRHGATVEQINASCHYEPWFLRQIEEIVRMEETIKNKGLPRDPENLRKLKAMGFSDRRLAKLVGLTEAKVAAHRRKLKVRPVFKRIDTCAAEFASPTAYMYSTYETGLAGDDGNEAKVSDKKKVMILGGGPNRIGQGIEFDYCCCHACFALHDAGYESIMVNCNPETVSTDYDTSDRLYFEPLTAEDTLEIIHAEQKRGTLHGVIVQFGGQTPLKLAGALEEAGVPILGTTPDAIDLAEDRDRFAKLIKKLNLRQPENGIARSGPEAKKIAKKIGFPVVIRPSYVLGGRAMEIVRDDAQLQRYITEAVVVSGDSPVLIDSYLSNATEVDVDVIADGKDVYVAGIMEHIEEAGIHSGDSACSLPPYSLKASVIAELEEQAKKLAIALKVVGLMNVQFAVKDDVVYILEVNPRASRTVPFVAKVIGEPVAKIAARVMAGEKLGGFKLKPKKLAHVAVKEAVFPFNRFPGVDVLLGPEMRSTGEVIGLDRNFDMAFAKSQLGAGMRIPLAGTVFVSVKESDKTRVLPAIKKLAELGFAIRATGGTHAYLESKGIATAKINKVQEGRPHVVDAIKNGDIQLVLNTTESKSSESDSKSIRQTAVMQKVPYYTTLPGILSVTKAIAAQKAGTITVKPLQDYFA
jgi:carbamoyl-phosphate synthase large subunit